VNQGFVLKRPMDLEVYAIGEMDWDEEYDHGWIINTDTRERIWTMEHGNTEAGGGADKNRVARTTIHLPEGNYAAFFATDDSHSAEEWNAFPPYDPDFWGLTLRVRDANDLRYVALQDYQHASAGNAVVALRGLRDDADEAQGFRLSAPMDVRIYALGEGDGGEMYDYGWIIDADTHERVWLMDYDDTEHGGGAEKNRLYDGIVHLPAGNYIAHFQTDDSHSYRDFNSPAPYDAEAWGITIFPGSKGAQARSIAAFDEADDPSTLAQIVRVRDDEHRRGHFKLDRDGRVRIYALGEGDDGEMYDYGWIENERGGVVWEMTYRMTEHAGGADKNRMLNKVILLPAGEYTVYYQTDDSHAYGDWNSRAPHDSSHWGITIRREED
jgi:hypothetical protein